MRIVIDLQGCQSESGQRGIGRYSLALTESLARVAGVHEISLVLNAAFPQAVEWIRDRLSASIPRERIHVFATPIPVAESDGTNAWRALAAERIRDAYVSALRPDVLLLSSLFEGFVDDASTSIVARPERLTAAILYDLIPLVRPDVLATPEARVWYDRKLASLGRADLLLAISEHARSEAMAALDVSADRIAVIGTAADSAFRPSAVDNPPTADLRARFGISRPYVFYAGGFDERKNVRNLITAFAALAPELRERHDLVLAGHLDERERRDLRRLAEDHGVPRERLQFPGR